MVLSLLISYYYKYYYKYCYYLLSLGEYHLENAVRFLKNKVNDSGLFNNSNSNNSIFRDELSEEETELLFSNDTIFKFTYTNAAVSSLIPLLETDKYIDIKLKINNDNNNNNNNNNNNDNNDNNNDNNNNNEIYFRLLLVNKDGGGTGGSRVWDAALFFSQWILYNGDFFKGKKVIELGAGLGLPSFAVSLLASSVTLTDMITEVINNFYLNIDSNSNTINTDNIHVMRLDWFDNDHREKLKNHEKYDTVIIADVIYTISVVDELIETIKATRANDIFVCMPKARQGASDFIRKMKDQGYSCKESAVPR